AQYPLAPSHGAVEEPADGDVEVFLAGVDPAHVVGGADFRQLADPTLRPHVAKVGARVSRATAVGRGVTAREGCPPPAPGRPRTASGCCPGRTAGSVRR